MDSSDTARTALVTGANQGLGRALVAGLAAGLGPGDRVLLTGRDAGRVTDAAAEVAAELPHGSACVEGRVLDVRDAVAIRALADELGSVDIVFSNAWARITPDGDPVDQVEAVAETSALGTLDKLDPRVRPRFAAAADADLDAVDELVEEWRAAVRSGRAESEGFVDSLNVVSKVAQVAAVRAYARGRRDADVWEGTLVAALCPGLIDTDASRPWFEDMSSAQTPAEAAAFPVELALGSADVAAWHGELLQFGKVLPWETGVPVPGRVVG
jgi:carbonyl reductase 1